MQEQEKIKDIIFLQMKISSRYTIVGLHIYLLNEFSIIFYMIFYIQ